MAVKDAVLKALTDNKGSYISGEELSSSLDVSRAAVWKAIKALREEGYTIEAVTNKGYVMPLLDNMITEESFRYALPQNMRKDCCFVYDTLDSTNLQAKRLLLEGKASSGCIVIANHQTAGRGRLGRSFFSPENGLYMSIIIRPDFDMSKSVLVTIAAAAAVAKAINDVCGQDARIKWVNDIFIEGKKVCGILTEAMTDFESGQIENLVIGIGINTSLEGFPEELAKTSATVDLSHARPAPDMSGNMPSNTNGKSLLAAEVFRLTMEYTAQLSDSNGTDEQFTAPDFLEIYRDKSLVIGHDIRVFKGAYRSDPTSELGGIPARVLGIDDKGGLQVIYTDGQRETLTTGEISIRLQINN